MAHARKFYLLSCSYLNFWDTLIASIFMPKLCSWGFKGLRRKHKRRAKSSTCFDTLNFSGKQITLCCAFRILEGIIRNLSQSWSVYVFARGWYFLELSFLKHICILSTCLCGNKSRGYMLRNHHINHVILKFLLIFEQLLM